MRREIAIKTVENSEVQSLRLVDSRGRRPTNTKISIYSQKYTPNPTPSTHSLPEEQSSSRTHAPLQLIRTRPQLRTVVSDSLPNDPHKLCMTEQKPKQHPSDRRREELRLDQRAIQLQMLAGAQAQWEGRLREMGEENARAINELRVLLMENQRKLAEKDQIIQRLMGRAVPKNTTAMPSPRNSNYEFLAGRLKDAENTLKVIIEAMVSEEQSVAMRIERVQQELIKYNGFRLANCRHRLATFIQAADARIAAIPTQTVSIPNVELPTQQIAEMRSQIEGISAKQAEISKVYRQDDHTQTTLQITLSHLTEKINELEMQKSRRLGHSLLFDQDEFFYPPSERRPYETNDDYEHFQEESEEDSTEFHIPLTHSRKKENRSPNCPSPPKPFF